MPLLCAALDPRRHRRAGWTPRALARAAEPFFTTRGPGEGTEASGLARPVFGLALRRGGHGADRQQARRRAPTAQHDAAGRPSCTATSGACEATPEDPGRSTPTCSR